LNWMYRFVDNRRKYFNYASCSKFLNLIMPGNSCFHFCFRLYVDIMLSSPTDEYYPHLIEYLE